MDIITTNSLLFSEFSQDGKNKDVALGIKAELGDYSAVFTYVVSEIILSTSVIYDCSPDVISTFISEYLEQKLLVNNDEKFKLINPLEATFSWETAEYFDTGEPYFD